MFLLGLNEFCPAHFMPIVLLLCAADLAFLILPQWFMQGSGQVRGQPRSSQAGQGPSAPQHGEGSSAPSAAPSSATQAAQGPPPTA